MTLRSSRKTVRCRCLSYFFHLSSTSVLTLAFSVWYVADWNETPQNADEQLEWEDNWDDEECDDDFSKKLREELASAEAAETANA